MYETVLVADRGFLAARVLRSCQRLGIKSLTLVQPGDESAPHAQAADEAVPFAPVDTDELPAALIEAARVSGAQAIHPGGTLPRRSAELAEAIRSAGIDWLGPDDVTDTGRLTDGDVGVTLTDGDVGVTLVDGRVVDGWRWLARDSGRPSMAESVTPDPALVALAERAAAGRGPVVSVAASAGLLVAVRPALAGVDRLVEARTGIDLVAHQLRTGSGDDYEPVAEPVGHALSLALFAATDHRQGVVTGWRPPQVEGVVIDSWLAEGREAASWPADPLLTLTATGTDRTTAWARLREAADQLRLDTPDVDLSVVRAILRDDSVCG